MDRSFAFLLALCALTPRAAPASVYTMEMPDGVTAWVAFDPTHSTPARANFRLHINFEKATKFTIRTRTSAGPYLGEQVVSGVAGTEFAEDIFVPVTGDMTKVWAQWEYLEEFKPAPPGHPELSIVPRWTVGNRSNAEAIGTLSTDYGSVVTQSIFVGPCPNTVNVRVTFKGKSPGWVRLALSDGSATDPRWVIPGTTVMLENIFKVVPKKGSFGPAGLGANSFGGWAELRFWPSGVDNPSNAFPPANDVAAWKSVLTHLATGPMNPLAPCPGGNH
ncbi:MAG: hypothetical protein M3M96_00775 [Candidatus Eremiobacteraeota bacterium]|nr:hypothetical protein [Candidatus Eremiobacteraeota bacterium]